MPNAPLHRAPGAPWPPVGAHGESDRAHSPLAPTLADCACPCPGRRLFTGLLAGAGMTLAWPAMASIPECKRSSLAKAVPADQVEAAARQQYRQMLQQASSERALVSTDEPQLQRLRSIAARIIPFTPACNPRASEWRWEVNLIASRSINAFCMPGGKIAFFYGILAELQLDDDEVAMIMGHEAAHALLEHAREQMSKGALTTGGLRLLSALFGLGQLGDLAAQAGAQLLTLKFSRDDEGEADRLGLQMAARAGYDPRSGVTLWQKMMRAGGSKPPQILSTHPTGPARIKDIESKLPEVLPVFQAAPKPPKRYSPAPPLPAARPRQP
jgi:predicted Zn-dependent protease